MKRPIKFTWFTSVRWTEFGLGFTTDTYYDSLWDFALILGPLRIGLEMRGEQMNEQRSRDAEVRP